MENIAQRNIRIADTLKAARASLESYWQDLTYYCLPRKAYIQKIKNTGDRLPTDIYDSTAIMSNTYFAAGMQAYMSSPQTKWFGLTIKDRSLMNKQSVLDYLRDTEDVLYDMINNSNFYQEDVEGYLSLGSIGTDVLYSEEDIKEDIRFDSLPIENVLITMDSVGRANGAWIEYEFDAQQAIDKFGKDAGLKIIDTYKKDDYIKKFKFLFCVYPRDIYNSGKKDAKNMPFASYWIDKDEKAVVRESGYREFPFHVSRFTKGKGDPYGYSPAMNIFADIKMLNSMEYTNIIAAQMAVAPPLEIPDEAFMRPYNFNPWGKNIKNAGFPQEHITPIITGTNVPMALEYLQYKQRRIEQAFYNDLFLTIEQMGKMTATEVSIRNNQRMQLLGSAIGNIMREKLSPVIHRLYAIAARNNKLPPLPQELMGKEYVPVYLSPLARAQKSLELQNVQQALQIIASFMSVEPNVKDKIDFDEATDYVAEITNISPKIIRDDAEVEAMREQAAMQQQIGMQMAALSDGTQIAKTATEADRNVAESQGALAGAGR